MTQQTLSVRRIVLALSLASLGLAAGCWKPEIKDAELGCGVDANVSAKCPNHTPVDAPVTGAADTNVVPDTAARNADAAAGDDAPTDTGVAPDTAPPKVDAAAGPETATGSSMDAGVALDTSAPSVDTASGADASAPMDGAVAIDGGID